MWKMWNFFYFYEIKFIICVIDISLIRGIVVLVGIIVVYICVIIFIRVVIVFIFVWIKYII